MPGDVPVRPEVDHGRLQSVWRKVLTRRSALETGCRAAGCTGGDLEDALQESVLHAFLRFGEPGAGERARGASWCYTLGRRIGLDLKRSTARRRERELRFARRAARGSSDPGSVLQQREDQLLVRRTLQALPLAERRAIAAVVLEGRSLRAASRLLGRSRPTVRSDLERGLARLRFSLGRGEGGMLS